MIYKFIIPSNYFLYSNMALSNGISNYLKKAPVFAPNDIATFKDVFRVIKLLNPIEWEKFIDPDITGADVIFYAEKKEKKYPYSKKLISWNRRPRSINNSFLIFLIYMMRKDKATILADVSYTNDVLTMELKPMIKGE